MWECGLKHSVFKRGNHWYAVTPYVGVWIETMPVCLMQARAGSLLMWECGLKQQRRIKAIPCVVTPYVGVWIETYDNIRLPPVILVTPYVGVWIETERDEIDRLA